MILLCVQEHIEANKFLSGFMETAIVMLTWSLSASECMTLAANVSAVYCCKRTKKPDTFVEQNFRSILF